ncbi:hypothetical protein QUW57_13345, partial [Phocaeicola plebeius]|uniref:hypothetical protein n=1 Tax=Phocaeicola plebeius TaxID=310297 RepID=UPI0025A31441
KYIPVRLNFREWFRLDWKDRQLEVNITASVFILNLDVSIEELSQSEKLMATALFFIPSHNF